jgi:aspartyl protease family protein
VLNSGASTVCLTAPLAAKMNVKPTEKDPPVTLVMPDGRELKGKLITLKSVRVGKFEVEDVECVVLGEEAVAADPQLGLSYLDSFKYEIDSAAKTLTMVKVSEGAVSSSVKGAK